MDRKRLFSIFLIVFIDLLGFSLILPLQAYYAKTFGASEFVTGLIVASYAAMQFVGAPILGRLSDRYGRRPILLVSIFGTAVGFLLLGFANALWMLFASRIIDGLTGGNISVAQAYISDVTDEKNRARGLGMIGAAFGLGFIIGPALGGGLGEAFGYSVPAFVAAAMAFINLVLVYAWLPESLTEEKRAEIGQRQRPPFTLGALIVALRRPFSGALLGARIFFGLAFNMFQTLFSLYAIARFNLPANQTGYILTFVGVLSVFTQAVFVGQMTKHFRDDVLIMGAVVVLALALFGWALTPSIPVLLVVLVPTALSAGILNVLLSSTLTKAVTPDEIGGILGLSNGLESLTRTVAPVFGGFILGSVGAWAPGALGGVIMLAAAVYVYFTIYNHPIAAEISARSAARASVITE